MVSTGQSEMFDEKGMHHGSSHTGGATHDGTTAAKEAYDVKFT
jgi:hypothetical protein